MVLNDILRVLRGSLGGVEGLRLVYLFGSYAEGRATPISDFDVAVVADNFNALMRLREAISETLKIPREKISVINLVKASPTLKIKILKYGVRVFGRGEEVIRLLETIPSDTVEVLEAEKGEFARWLKNSNPIDENIVKSIIVQVEGDVKYLRRVLEGRSLGDVVGNEDLRRAFERALHTSIEGIIDLLRHITSGLNLGVVEVYKDYVKVAEEAGIISPGNAAKLAGLVDVRHTLIHRYRGLNFEELWEEAKLTVEVWPGILEEVKGYIRKVYREEAQL